ncbi:winged helix-turn-helix domain-containing protein [Devosia sp. SL43]|uniref:winged helix-turn-helix domain-containing protein n=1 Tax=Devosia sp. SL43 TaxID=2806348 RepID=UPI001F02C694|nr:winged helix-turn-helix domain-containing protein [Devosia sp. SL43]UJW85879.1 winged helix-turn-helix domain-containing protein [Devosia sp. SL43]
MLCFAGFELDERRAELRGPDGAPTKLRPKSFDLLVFLANNPGRVVDKQELMAAVWPNIHVADDSLFQCIRELRVALSDDQRQLIRVVSGRGYVLETVVTGPDAERASNAETTTAAHSETVRSRTSLNWRSRWVVAGFAMLCVIAGVASVASARFAPPTTMTLAVLPIVYSGSDADGAVTAAGVTDQLIDGLSGIGNIKVTAPDDDASGAPPDLIIRSELREEGDSWTLKARLTERATGTITSLAPVTVDSSALGAQLQQVRLAAGLGDKLARLLNDLVEGAGSVRDASTGGRVAIEQATASINQTTHERFAAAQAMLEGSLANQPDNVDVQIALAALQMRGIQMVWYDANKRAAAASNAEALLKRAIAARPRSIAVLEAQCRFLSATNAFAESLVACAQVLSFNPWDGSSLYLVGLGQLNLGRLPEALATFELADRYDTPSVSRWTWLLGAGWTNLLMDRNAEAVSWLERSIAITPASGRSHMLLATAYERLGRHAEAAAAIATAMQLRPNSTISNVRPPTQNSSPVFVSAGENILQTLRTLGLPDR